MITISLERIQSTAADAERYLDLLTRTQDNISVQTHLGVVFGEKTKGDVLAQLAKVDRLFAVVSAPGTPPIIAGRVELTTHMNNFASVLNKYPRGLTLGDNACYFVNEKDVAGVINPDKLHEVVAALAINAAFTRQGDEANGQVPWLPVVGPESEIPDPSRGWLTLADHHQEVVILPAATGWFSEGTEGSIDTFAYHPAYTSAPITIPGLDPQNPLRWQAA